RDIYRCETLDEVRFFAGYAGVPVIVQRFLPGEQFSIDVLCDLDGRALNVIPRTMIESKGGESIKGQTIADRRLIDLGRTVAEGLRLVGPATIQCFDEPEGLPVTDINTRFGGAFPLPLAAGSRYPELILRMSCGERVEPHVGRFTPGITMTRFYDSVILAEAAGSVAPGGVSARRGEGDELRLIPPRVRVPAGVHAGGTGMLEQPGDVRRRRPDQDDDRPGDPQHHVPRAQHLVILPSAACGNASCSRSRTACIASSS